MTDKTLEPLEIILVLIQSAILNLKNALTEEQQAKFKNGLALSKEKIIKTYKITDPETLQLIEKLLS